MDKIVGIDLGTTNSVIAHVTKNGDPEIIPSFSGNRIVPSVVNYSDNRGWVVGEAAQNIQVRDPENTVKSVKRKMGSDEKISINEEEYSPEQISSHIINKLISGAEEKIDQNIDGAVITVPAYFNDKQRKATIDAGRISSISVERIINEPTAAAIAYGVSGNEDKNLLVYDLGGGTFDVSVLDVSSGLYEIKATEGINELGGDDWTQRIVDQIYDRINNEYDLDIADPKIKARIWEEAEIAKKKLSEKDKVNVIIPFLTETDDGQIIDIDYTITRDEFESLTSDLLDLTVDPIHKSIESSGIKRDNIDEVLLVGGATRMPQVKNKVFEITGIEPRDDINPEEVVSKGAAIQAAILDDEEYCEKIEDIVLLDVTPIDLGVEVKGGLFEPLIEKNTSIPARSSKTFTTAKNGQDSVTINVYQGGRRKASNNMLLESFKLTGIPPMTAGKPNIKVQFTVDENGILQVSATEMSTGISKDITIEGKVGMTDEEIEKAKENVSINKSDGKISEEDIRVENLAKTQISQAEKILNHYNIPKKDEENIREDIKKLKDIMEKNQFNTNRAEEIIEELEGYIQEVSVKLR
jgi:molecular chaperone DnaK